eukprot:jgi/Mesvir1/7517/Mv19272-RA.1
MQTPSLPSHDVILTHVMAVPGVGARILGDFPLLDRSQLRSTCWAFLAAVDESLEGLSELYWEDIADVASRSGGLDWLLRKCPNLHTLSFWPRGGHKMHRWDGKSFMSDALKTVAMPSQSLLGLACCRRLRSLNLAGCAADVDDPTLAAVAASCRELEVLDVTLCHVTDESIAVVAQCCPGLQELTANQVKQVTDASLEQLAQHCPRLRRLSLDRSSVTDDGITPIALQCPDLCLLSVNDCQGVTDASLIMLAEQCPALEYLGLSALDHVTDAGMIAVARGCPALRGLELAQTRGVTDAGIREVANHCNQLEFLASTVSASAVCEVARKCPRLRHLDTHSRWSKVMNDEVMSELAACCTDLRYLSIDSLSISDAGLIALAGGCQQLESLYLHFCDGVTKFGLAFIALGCPRLRCLHLTCCDAMHDPGLRMVGEHCPGLEEFTFTGWTSIWEEGMGSIARNCARLRVFNMPSLHGITEPALRVIVEHCRQLEELDISHTRYPLGACMAAIGRNCARLRGFRAHRCINLTDADVAIMLQGSVGTHLLHLDLGYTSIGDVALADVASHCAQLRWLDVSGRGQTNVTAIGLQSIAAGCRQLTYLNLGSLDVTDAMEEALQPIYKRGCRVDRVNEVSPSSSDYPASLRD